MPYVYEGNDFDARWLPDGRLMYRDRFNQYQVAAGVSVAGYHEFWWLTEQISKTLLEQKDNPSSLKAFLIEHQQFREDCSRCLELSGIAPDSVSIDQLVWLLFDDVTPDRTTVIPSPVKRLNQLPPLKYPEINRGGDSLSGKAAFVAALWGACDNNLNTAIALSKSESAREVFATIEERAWQTLDPEKKLKAWGRKKNAEMREKLGFKKAGQKRGGKRD